MTPRDPTDEPGARPPREEEGKPRTREPRARGQGGRKPGGGSRGGSRPAGGKAGGGRSGGKRGGGRSGGKSGGGRSGGKSGGGRSGGKPGGKLGRGPARKRPDARGPARPREERPRGPRPIVAVFAKAPEPGAVKTRLSPFLRAAETADLYRALLLDTVEAAESTGAEVVVLFTPSGARRAFERLLGRHRRILSQGPGDLGQRLAYAFERLCDGRRPVLAIGSDCPGVSPERIREAADALGNADVTLGPSVDGGYYLIGATRSRPALFRGIEWSTDRVLEATMERIGEAGLRARVLPVERDLDTPEDLFELYAGTRTAAWEEAYPRTWKELHALLPPRRVSELEEAVAEARGERPGDS